MSIRPLAPTPAAAARVRHALESSAAVARNLNREYEATSPTPVGVLADQTLEIHDLKILVSLVSSEGALRSMLQALSKDQLQELLQELRSAVEDAEEGMSEYEYLAYSNHLLRLYQGTTTPPRALPMPELVPPRRGLWERAISYLQPNPPAVMPPPPAVMQALVYVPSRPSRLMNRPYPEVTEEERLVYARWQSLLQEPPTYILPPPPDVTPVPDDAAAAFGFSFTHLGLRVALLDERRPTGEPVNVGDFFLMSDLYNVEARMMDFIENVYMPQDEQGRELLRDEARSAAPLSRSSQTADVVELRAYHYDYVWAARSRFYQTLGEVLQLHFNSPNRAAFDRFRERQEARATALSREMVDLGGNYGKLLCIRATIGMSSWFADEVN